MPAQYPTRRTWWGARRPLNPTLWPYEQVDALFVSVLHVPYEDAADHGRAAVLMHWPEEAVEQYVLDDNIKRYGPWPAWSVIGTEWSRVEVTDDSPGVPLASGEHLQYWQSCRTEAAAVQIATEWLRNPRPGSSRWGGHDGPLIDSSVQWLPYPVRDQLRAAWRRGLGATFGTY